MRRLLKIFMVCLVTLPAGCGRPPQPTTDTVYQGLSENLPRLDPGILADRRIVIDPGHGGHFQGTLGQNGLQESRVNMGVALYLWGLLREAGAEVHLTRSAERDFLVMDDSTLVRDLATRVAAIDSLDPDIVVSIHHNAEPLRDPSKNAVETYYRFGDPGSRDLAFAVHRHLMRNLGIGEGEVRPGNYYILRNVEVPAILGEGSYLTDPLVEKALQLSEKQQLEAEAYFLGILEYFSRGTPRLEVASPMDSVLDDVPLVAFGVSDVGGLGIDPAGIDLQVNGHPANAYMSDGGRRITYRMPWDTPNGNYAITIGVRNVLGNSSRIHHVDFRLDLSAVGATFDTNPSTLPTGGGAVRVRARLLDRRGLSVADSTIVQIRSAQAAVPDSGYVHGGFLEFPATIEGNPKSASIVVTSGGRSFELVIKRAPEAGRSLVRFTVVDALSRTRLHDVAIVSGDSLVATGSNSAVYFLPSTFDGATDGYWFSAPGYMPRRIDATTGLPGDTMYLQPWYDGILLGVRFVLDPEGGFDATAGRGQLGLSGPHANLQVARYTAEYLRAAGAEVLLTRTTEQTLSPRDVVDVTNRFRANRYIEIRHRNAPADSALKVEAFYFPGSGTGEAMSGVVADVIASSLGIERSGSRDLVTFPLQQTACPAIVVSYPSLADLDEELRLAEPWYQHDQAYALFAGILRHYGADIDSTLSIRVQPEAEPAGSNWLVTVDRTWHLLTGPDGTARFTALGGRAAPLIDVRRGDVHMVRRTLPGDPRPLTVSVP